MILPFTILRRLECVLEANKDKLLGQVEKLKAMPKLEEDAREKLLLRAAGESFYNTSPMNLSTLGSADIKSNLLTYINSFSKDAREIFEHFKFSEFVGLLDEANLLFKVVEKVASTDLSPKAISNHDMGLVFEELIRRFAESSNETAGEHFNAAMRKVYELHGERWTDEDYGQLADVEAELRVLIKAEFVELKEGQVKDLLSPKTWLAQKQLLAKAKQLQAVIGSAQSDDFNAFEGVLKKVLKQADVSLDASERKQLIDALSWTNPDAEPVIRKVLKTSANPLYGDCEYRGQVMQFQPDSELRDNEDVPLTAETARGANVDAVNEAYFAKEVAPHVPDAWIDANKCDERDGQIGVVGYEIPFNRHFYEYEPPRDLAEIDADLDALSAEIMQMLREVHS